ncbi:MAG: winged helix-turn-helix domain-containing protein [Kangiellaceae bacterium]|nr:winged helix-turn-helix domain-containing protein [Kangiellaceae bacterium]
MKSKISLGSLLLDANIHQLYVGTEFRQIEPRVSALIYNLYLNKNSIVTREELINSVWNSQVVSNNALNRAVSQARKVLSLSTKPSPCIETVPRVGYKLVIINESSDVAEKPLGKECNFVRHYEKENSNRTNGKETNLEEPISNENESRLKKSTSKRIKNNLKSSPWLSFWNKNTAEGFNFSSLKVAIFIVFTVSLLTRYVYQEFISNEIPAQYSQRVITTTSGVERLGKFSPDGRFMAYVGSISGSRIFNLFVKNLTDDSVVQITNDEFHIVDFSWSPNSKKIVLSRWNSIHDRRCAIDLLEFNRVTLSVKSQTIMNCSERAAVHLAWNGSSDMIFFNSRESYDKPYYIEAFSLLSKRTEQLTLPPQSGNYRGDYYVSGNTSGTMIAVIRYLGTYDMNLDIFETDSRQLIYNRQLSKGIDGLSWMGQNRLLLRRGNNLYKYDFQTDKQEFFYAIGKNSGDIGSDANGRRVLFSTADTDINLVEYKLNLVTQSETARKDEISEEILLKSNAKLVEASSGVEIMPSYSNDFKQMAFLSNRSGKYQIWLLDAENKLSQLTQSPVSLSINALQWSPDKKLILIQHDDEIFTVETRSGTITRVIDRSHRIAVANWSFDGRAVFYSSEKSGQWQIWKYSFESGKHQQITQQGGYSAKQAKNGDLYLSRIHEPGLWLLKAKRDPTSDILTSGFTTPKLLIERFSGTNWMGWRLTGSYIYYFGSVPNLDVTSPLSYGVMKFNLKSEISEMMIPFKRNQLRYFDVSPTKVIITEHSKNEGSIQLLSPD